jgi:2-polyprenyl-3-methyl-5-hydroxy-6-metoxy-1,4-benzoquinol methylase
MERVLSSSEPLPGAVARRIRGLPAFLRYAVKNAVSSVVPEPLLAFGAYRPEVIRPQDWESGYASGRWSYMTGVPQLGRYSVIVGYYGFFKPGGSVLDVGCGEGILQQKLASLGYRRYLGIDICANAIAKAAARADSRTEFRHVEAESFVPDQKFDAIIFNEVLYYFSDPAEVVRRLTDSLEPDGIMIASIYSSPIGRRKSSQIWRLVGSVAEFVDSTTATNREVWTIKVLRPKLALRRSHNPPSLSGSAL